jgi:tRNA (guanine-N7-)-methyltransferase
MKKLKTPKRIRNHVNPLSYKEEFSFEGFENKKNIVVDIGSYRGEFGEKLLEKFGEDKNFIFFEIRKPFFEYLEKVFKDFENVKVFSGDAGRNLKSILKPSIKKGVKVEKVFINFPDPWFKSKHKKRRVVSENFLRELGSWIPGGTEIIFQTDQAKLFFETRRDIKSNGSFKIRYFWRAIWGITTYWEEMKKKERKIIWRMKFYKK